MVAQYQMGHKNPQRDICATGKTEIEHKRDGQAVTGIRTGARTGLALILALVLSAGMTGAVAETSQTGSVTNLPLPRYVSMKASESNVRRGPSLTHRIDWVFKRRDMPVQVTAEHGHWRRVRDREGAGGWVHYALLSGVRTVIVEKDLLPLHARPDQKTPVLAALELGVVARLGPCDPQWCRISAGGFRGWALKSQLWGVEPQEIRD